MIFPVVAWECVDEPHEAGPLVGRQVLARVGDQLVLGRVRPRDGYHVGARQLAAHRVG